MRLRKKGQRNAQLSDEELQRTQVLNLIDFKETARIERITSKKPAAILAILGVCLIALGLFFPAMQSLSTRHDVQKRVEPVEEEEVKVVEETMICHWEHLNNPNGTDENIDVTFNFRDDKLTKSKKDYKLTKSATATTEPTELQSYLTALQSFLMQTSGYSVSVKTIDNGSITTTDVDYTLLDPTKIPATHQSNYRFDVKNKKDDSKDTVKKSMTALQYKCNIE